ncbi:MAG: PAS domain-containing protein [Nitrospiraceae bacterium]|nr:MAG: PAS domain-containing protein [Nitrospiraceae bacterium]
MGTLKARVLTPLTVALCILLGAFIYNVYQTQQQYILDDVLQRLESVQKLFEKQLTSETEKLSAIIDLLSGNEHIQSAWLARDRTALLKISSPLLSELSERLQFTHFYFHDGDRVNFLRVYNPERFGDIINRFTLIRAQESGRPSSGIELGKLGTMTLRVVHPWRIDSQVVGFIEMGEEIDHIIHKLQDILDVELYVSIYKEFLKREDWETGMRLFGHESNWNQLSSSVIVSQTLTEIPADFSDFLQKGQHRYMELVKGIKLVIGKHRFSAGVIPLFDAGSREIGDIVVLYDITELVSSSRRTIVITFLISSSVGLALFIFFSKILGNVETELGKHRQHLEELVEGRTDELRRSNENLLQEINERGRVEDQLKKTQTSLNKAQQIARLGNWDWDIVSGEFWLSDETHRIFGREREDFGATYEAFLDNIYPDDRKLVIKSLERSMHDGIPLNLNHRIVLPNGTVRIVHEQAELTHDEAGRPVRLLGTVQDVTERRQMEEAVQRSRNLESLGVLAGGLAHDFNNLLAAVLGNIELVKDDIAADTESQEMLTHAEEACLRARHLTAQLLTFSKGGEPLKEIISMDKLMRNSCEFMLSGSNVRCTYDIAENLNPVKVDRRQMEQVFQNLLMNAKEAMPEGGTVRLQAENFKVDGIGTLPLNQGKYVEISVEDEGTGITADILPRVFEPYFSTKQKGDQKGIGLGLAICHSVLTKHGGHISVQSTLNKGTSFKIYLPAALEESEKDEERYERVRTGSDREARILLMEDEEALIRLGEKILRRMGHRVDSTRNGNEAVELYIKSKELGEAYDLVILDLTIRGGMGGQKTMKKLIEINPDVKAIVSSGYADDPVMANYEEYGFKAAIAKPFTIAKFKAVIRKAFG